MCDLRPFLRSVLALSLALALALASVGLAVARGQPGPSGTIVICTGMGLQAVAVDAGGRPVGTPHLCPDGLAALAALAPAASLPPGPEARPRAIRALPVPDLWSGERHSAPRSRGPSLRLS